jgi:chemotaxis receptor (MCP) glutamine deamidase CheD
MASENAEQFPFAFADTGIPLLLESAWNMGMQRSSLHITLVGGAQTVNPPNILSFGKQNLEAAIKIINSNGLHIHKSEVGGHAARTIQLKVKDGVLDLEVRGQGMRAI